ncbi:T cell receptor alpha chain MC.7.G5-like isoform 6-T6 [Pholidichthys leucotaenia]
MERWLWIILAAFFSECKGEDKVIQTEGFITATQENTVTLECRAETTHPYPYLFWYKQELNGFPKYILRRDRNSEGNAPEFSEDKFDAEFKDNSAPLRIHNLQVSDSAVYYCALRPTGGYKLYFGDGTRLTIETENEYQPSYYKLEEKVDDKTLCLATGFSRHNATSTHEGYKGLFNSSSAIRIKDDSLYNQVIFTDDDGKNCEHGPSVGDCETNLKGDEMVNLVSLTVTGLRVIFIKTIIFNILMTLRLWLSQ